MSGDDVVLKVSVDRLMGDQLDVGAYRRMWDQVTRKSTLLSGEQIVKMKDPTLAERISAAQFIAAYGPDADLIKKMRLMWPSTSYTNAEVLRESSRLLASVLIGVLQEMPQQVTDKIQIQLSGARPHK